MSLSNHNSSLCWRHQTLQLVGAQTQGKAQCRPGGDTLGVPQEADLLEPHERDSCYTADGQHGATRPGGKRHQLPERIIHWLMEHLDGGLHQWHVVDHSRANADQCGQQYVAALGDAFQPLGVLGQDIRGLQRGHAQQHAGEEQQAAEVHEVQRRRHAVLAVGCNRSNISRLLISFFRGEVSNLGHQPKHPQRHHHAQVGRQPGDHLHNGHHEDAAHAHQQDHLAVPAGDGCFDLRRLLRGSISLGLPPDPEEGHHSGDEGGQEEPHHSSCRGNLPLDPQHGGGNITNRAPGPAGICGNDHQTAAGVAPVLVVRHNLLKDLDAHNGGSEVVNDRAQKEGEDADDGHKTPRLLLGAADDKGCHHREALHVVDGLDDSHGRQQKKDHAAHVREALDKLAVELLMALC
mmetsp:Transcript_53794/g.128614  ORF Transcript_53794/g.128614 Transcript_53794/m.128614 type:complete len:405 (+) Transcript_53794:218-1432(+)